jgi:GNAT superfamily N-acetyltransferase
MKLGPDSPSDDAPLADRHRPRTVAVERTYLQLLSLTQLQPAPAPHVAAVLEALAPCPVDTWRALYDRIGSPWQWHDRDSWDQGRMEKHLQRADIHVYHVVAALPSEQGFKPDATVGFLELEQHADGSVEIVYLGLVQQAFGLGLGGWLVSEAVRVAFGLNACRVWLHTCTLDAPAALPNYLARGFAVERREQYHTTVSP